MKKIWALIATFCLCIVLFACQILLMTLIGTGGILTKDNVKKIISNVDIFDQAKSSTNIEVISGEVETTKTYDESYLQPLYDKAAEYDISKTTVNAILSSTAFNEFIGEYVGGNMEYFLLDGPKPEDNPTNVLIKTIEGSIDAINYDAKLNLSVAQRAQVIKALKANGASISDKVPSTTELISIMKSEHLSQGIDIIRYILSTSFKLILVAIIILLSLGIFLLNREPKRWTKWIGMVSIVSGIQIFAQGIILKFILIQIIETYNTLELAFRPIINSSGLRFIFMGVIAILIGIGLVITGRELSQTE